MVASGCRIILACYHPLRAYRAAIPNEKGRRPLLFSRRESGSDEGVDIACGQCIGCRLERSRQWAIRSMHEASLYDDNCFLTLTYSDEHLPLGGTLVRRDFQLFLKRVRKYAVRRRGRSFRFYGCGEYGESTFRPHYHVLCFDLDFPDKRPWRKSPSGHSLCRSEELEDLWGFGSAELGGVTFHSAGYVARYCLKKVVGKGAAAHYLRRDAEGREYQLLPEFAAQSLGVGRPWLERFKSDVYPDDFVVVNGRKMKPPVFYDRYLEKNFPDEYDELLERKDARAVVVDNGVSVSRVDGRYVRRLHVKEEVAASRLATFSGRSL